MSITQITKQTKTGLNSKAKTARDKTTLSIEQAKSQIVQLLEQKQLQSLYRQCGWGDHSITSQKIDDNKTIIKFIFNPVLAFYNDIEITYTLENLIV